MHLLLGVILVLGAGGRPNQVIDTGFRPSIDLPVVTNATGRGAAIHGMCNGIDEMSMSYFAWRRADPTAPTLAAVTQQIKAKAGGDKYLHGMLGMATQHSYSSSKPRGNYRYAGADPKGFGDELANALKTGRAPKSIVFGAKEGGISHRMTVYAADQVQGPNGPQWAFRVADSNLVNQPGINPDDIRLMYVEATRGQPAHWAEQVGGKVLGRFDTGDMVRTPVPKPSIYVDLVKMGGAGVPLGKIRANLAIPEIPPPGVSLGPGSVEVSKDPQAGGVIVRFDPALFNGSVSEAELASIEEDLQGFLGDDQAKVGVFRLAPRKFDLHLVSVEALLTSPEVSLTRIRGFVRGADGEVLIAGEREAGIPSISRDVLVVAMRAIYEQGAMPFVSLDPSADAPHGPQRVRMGGLGEGLEQSQFALDMLDADYLMKRITLGDVVAEDSAFRSWVQIVAERRDETDSFHRLWLAPLTTPIGDLFEWKEGAQLAVLFDTHVQVKTEQMRAQMGQLVPGGGKDASAEEAAGILTRRYDALCEEFPEFRRLRGVFEASQLAAGLRAYGVRSAALDSLLKVKPGLVPVPTTYAGIGPRQIEGMRIAVSGGVEVPSSYVSRTAVSMRALAPMLGPGNSMVVNIPKVITVDGSASLGVEIEARLASSKEALLSAGYSEAAERAREVLAMEKDHLEARVVLALSLASLNQSAEALLQFDQMGDLTPKGRAIKALLYARVGDAAGVARETKAALASGALDGASLASMAVARLLTLDLKGAKEVINTLRALSPTSPFVIPLMAQVADMESRPVAERERRAKLFRQIPPSISSALSHALTNVGEMDRANGQLEDALSLLQSGEVKVPSELAVPYRLRLALMMGYASKGAAMGPESSSARVRAHALYAQAVKDQPASGLPHLLRANIADGFREPDAEIVKWLKLAGSSRLDTDPVYPDIRRLMGNDQLVNGMAMEMWLRRTTPKEPHFALLDFVIGRLAGQPEVKLLKALRTADGPALVVDMRGGVDELSQVDKKQSLARFTRVEASVPRTMKGTEVGFIVAGRIYAYIGILQLQLSQRAGADANLGRGVNLLRRANAGPAGRDQNATLIALMWVMNSGLMTQDIVADSSIGTEMEALEKELRSLLDGKVPIASARPRLAALEKRLVASLGRMRATVSKSLASSEKVMGPFSRAAHELSLVILQDFLSQQRSPFRDAEARNSALAATPEFKSLSAASDRAGQSMFVLGNVEGKWNALMALCVSGTDFMSAAALVSLSADMYQLPQDGLRRLLERYAMQARFKAGG